MANLGAEEESICRAMSEFTVEESGSVDKRGEAPAVAFFEGVVESGCDSKGATKLTMSEIDHIPVEIIGNILLRLSVKDLFTCKLVSKQWLAIIESPHIVNAQLQRSISTNSNAALFFQTELGALLHLKDDESPLHQIYPKKSVFMGSCHGLICISLIDYENPDDLILLNPTTGNRHTVSGVMDLKWEPMYSSLVGFGYDELTQDYKVVRFTVWESVEIYSVRAKTFSKKCHHGIATWDLRHVHVGVFAGGALHWCIADPVTSEPVILAFDLGPETFRKLPKPKLGHEDWKLRGVGVVGPCLCVSAEHPGARQIGVWFMIEYEKAVQSWYMVYRIRESVLNEIHIPFSVIPVGCDRGRIVLMINRKRLVSCGAGEDYHDILTDDRNLGDRWYRAAYCLESLVKVFPNHQDIDG